VALITAFLVVVLLVLAGFVTDFGMAYNHKRQLQTGADAAALAATQFYMDELDGAPCTQPAIDALRSQAEAEADAYMAENVSGATGQILAGTAGLHCNGKGVEVVYAASGETPSFFGPLAGSGGSITTSREAAAAYDAGIAAGGLRPWGICSKVVNTTQTVTFVPMKGGSTAANDPTGANNCGSAGPPGGWWVAQCNGQGQGTGATEAAVTNGCPTEDYQPVPGQPSTGPSALSTYLRNYCPNRSENATCLASDTGNNFHNASEEWQGLVGQTIKMPVFCFPPSCAPAAYSAQGQNASYAIHQIATVEICGFELSPRPASTGWPTSGPCATANPLGYTSSDVTNGGGIFLVIKALSGPTPWEGDGNVTNLRLTE
jgi:hypothetical protein